MRSDYVHVRIPFLEVLPRQSSQEEREYMLGKKKNLKGETCTMICCMLAAMQNDSNTIDEP